MTKLSRKMKIALSLMVNAVLFAALIGLLVNNIEGLLPLLLTAGLSHICVCGSLLYFLYLAPAEDKKTPTRSTTSVGRVPATISE